MNIQQAYDSVRKFNTISNNLDNVSIDSVASQIEFIKEELDETFDAFTQQDATELLDGACDLFVTVSGLMQKLEASGFNVEKALVRINDNNLSKLPTKQEHNKNPNIQPEDSVVEFSDYGHVAYRRPIDGKLLKPNTFVPVSLFYIPQAQ